MALCKVMHDPLLIVQYHANGNTMAVKMTIWFILLRPRKMTRRRSRLPDTECGK